MASSYTADMIQKDYFEDLTSNKLLDRYEVEQLNNLSIDGRVYALPGPASIRGIYYNKKLFESYGWQIPTTINEFISLCQKIDQDTNGLVQAWNPNAKYEGEFLSAMEAFCYTELFGGVENRTWYNKFLDGDATFASHMQPFYDLFKRFVDSGIINKDYFTYSTTTRMNEFKAGQIAMINNVVGKNLDSENCDAGFFSFPTTMGNEGYLVQASDYTVSLLKKNRTEKQKDASQRFLDYVSTSDAQKFYINNALMISSLKDPGDINENLPDAIKNAQASGHMFSQLSFKDKSYSQSYSPLKLIRSEFLSILNGEKTSAQSMADIDTAQKAAKNGQAGTLEGTIATATKDFTILETSNYFADMFREKAEADIGLVLNNVIKKGNVMRIFKGNLTASNVTTLKPRSLASKSTLIKVSMTGKQIIDALNNPFDGSENAANCVYAVSGLKCTIAPWNKVGNKILSVTMADGTEINETKLYTVAIWKDTVNTDYITEELQSYTGTFE